MVDGHLPHMRTDERRLRFIFLDLNAYFASVEQQEQPELRGKPIAVAPMLTDSTCAIAASYEAKRFGIKTGTKIADAKEMCRELIVVAARPPLYVHYHNKVLEAVEDVLPVDKVCSIDEMRFRLLGSEAPPAVAMELARRLKRAIRDRVGQHMSCSVGIGPNAFLAKIGTELQKPDGLVMIQKDDLPHRLHPLKLTDFTGINRRMQARLNAAGIFNAEQLCAAERDELRRAFGSIVGERWWYLLRGYEVDQEEHERKSLSHSHVLPPDLRTEEGCREVLLRLLQKASARLRANGLWASSLSVHVSGKRPWKDHRRLPPTQDSMSFNEALLSMWERRDFAGPNGVGIAFHDLAQADAVTPSLFEETEDRTQLSHAVDQVNQRFGKNKVFLASVERARDTADEKIAFDKTWLFSEGAGDNQWKD